MEFSGKGTPMSLEGLNRAINTLDTEQAAFWAVIKVESSGFGYLADRRPKILFERHIFHRQTGGRFSQAHSAISNPQSGAYQGGAAEYERLISAMALDREQALKSASWGIAQVMGFNHQMVGFDTVDAMVAKMVESEDEQIMAMVAFIRHNGLDAAMRDKDWPTFARGYNGSNYAKNRYDEKLAAAYTRSLTRAPDLPLRAAQAALFYLGFNPGAVDGLWGERTRSAVRAYQSGNAMQETGELDEATRLTLMDKAFAVE